MAWESQGHEIPKVHYSMEASMANVSKKFLVWNGMGCVIKNTSFSFFGLIFEKKATELRLWGHAKSFAHPVLFGKQRHIVVFCRQVCVRFLYLSCSAILYSLGGWGGGEFNSYNSKRLGQIWSISN